jgi:prepilin-type N-terminal cleavage/methylation domain-containing protein
MGFVECYESTVLFLDNYTSVIYATTSREITIPTNLLSRDRRGMQLNSAKPTDRKSKTIHERERTFLGSCSGQLAQAERQSWDRWSAHSGKQGFSLIELLVVLAIAMVLMAICPPLIMNVVSAMKTRYAATDFSGLLQKVRIEAARKNTFYPIAQSTLSSGQLVYFVDLNKDGVLDSTEPQLVFERAVSVHFGTGSGAPGEAALVASLNLTPYASGQLPNFNARGVPCVLSGGTCPQTPGAGFVWFLSRSGPLGANWASVAVTPSGRVRVWTHDGQNWIQQ